MSGKAATGAAAKKMELTPREVEVLAAAWQSFKSDPETSAPALLLVTFLSAELHKSARLPACPFPIPSPLDLHPNYPTPVDFHSLLSTTTRSNHAIQIDIPKLSQLVGFQNPRSAANLMGQIKKKLTAMEANGDFSVAGVPKAKPAGPATARGAAASASARSNRAAAAAKRKSAAAEDAGAEADNEASEATPGPVQKRRATGRGRKAVKSSTPIKEEEEGYDEEDGDDEGASASASASSVDDKAQVAEAEADDNANIVKDEANEQPQDEGMVKDEAAEEPKPKTKTKKIRDENDPITMFTNLNDTSDEDDI